MQTLGVNGAFFRIFSNEYDVERYEPVENFSPSREELAAFEGAYESYDAETTLVVSVEDGELTIHRRPAWKTTLAPQYTDTFDAPELGFVRFRRDPRGRVLELSLRQPRVYDMRFRRVEEHDSQ